LIASSSSDQLVRLWDLRYENILQTYQLHEKLVSSVDFHPSGKYLITSSLDEMCKIIDLLEGRSLFNLQAHEGPVHCAQFSPDGDHFATASKDHSIYYWKGNLELPDEHDDDELHDITADLSSPPLQPFDSLDDLKSIGGKMNHLRLEESPDSECSPTCSVQNSQYKASTSKQDTPTIFTTEKLNSLLNHPEEPNEESDTCDLNTHSPTADGIRSFDVTSISILKCILTQLGVISDSILNIDERLTALEDKFSESRVD